MLPHILTMMEGNHKNTMPACMQIQNYTHSFERLLEFDSFSLQELFLFYLNFALLDVLVFSVCFSVCYDATKAYYFDFN